MTDYRYRCVGCQKEFTLHADSLDPYEFDPACPWCEDTTGLPCYVPPASASPAEHLMAEGQAALMASINGAKGGEF